MIRPTHPDGQPRPDRSDMTSCQACTSAHHTPADAPEYQERRVLLKQGTLAAVATLLTACAHRIGSPATAPTRPIGLGVWTLRVRPADFPELARTGGIARVDGESDKPVAVVRTASGFAAFSLRCPHAGVTVEAKDGAFACPGHGARFAADGTWSGGHPAKNLRALEVAYDSTSEVLTITT